jgi:lipoprotein-anchoring transpeptidase ErfK/SrfK
MGENDRSRHQLSRRGFCLGSAAFGLAASGCTTIGTNDGIGQPPYYASRANYSRLRDEPYPVPSINIDSVNKRFLRQTVLLDTKERPGTIIVDPYNRFLYLVQDEGKALRYGVGVGRAGFLWAGRAYVGWKRAWPTWTPPPAMVAREPQLVEYAKGMEPGLQNPLGARAIYIYRDGRDTMYRLHGTNQPRSIGKAVSSGCIRLFNQDIIDLYDRVKPGAKIVVLTEAQSSRIA